MNDGKSQRQARIDAMKSVGPLNDDMFGEHDRRDKLNRQRASLPPDPPLPPESGGGRTPPMDPLGSLEGRVSRLELGFCGAFILIFGAIIFSYLLLSGKLDDRRSDIAAINTNVAELRGDIRVAAERNAATAKQIDRIAKKVGVE